MTNYILCHGFNVKDGGKETIDKLKEHMYPEDTVQEVDYGWFGLFSVRWFNDNIASVVAGMANKDSVGIAHSNGCAILVDAASRNNKIKHLVLINPALDTDTKFPDTLESVDVFHNRYDDTVTIGSWLPGHVWGEMGKVGYKGNDHRIRNHETFSLFGAKYHSGVLNFHARQLMRYIKSLQLGK